MATWPVALARGSIVVFWKPSEMRHAVLNGAVKPLVQYYRPEPAPPDFVSVFSKVAKHRLARFPSN